MKNIVLIGMMGCGKSTLGTLLAEKLDRTFTDTDALIEQREGCSINEIFAAKGEGHFRNLELTLSDELGRKQGRIIACGGGLPLQAACMTALKQNGTVIWLRRDPGETYDTMDTTARPLAQQGRQDFLDRFAQREPVYRRWADLIIDDFSSPEVTLNNILEALQCEF